MKAILKYQQIIKICKLFATNSRFISITITKKLCGIKDVVSKIKANFLSIFHSALNIFLLNFFRLKRIEY